MNSLTHLITLLIGCCSQVKSYVLLFDFLSVEINCASACVNNAWWLLGKLMLYVVVEWFLKAERAGDAEKELGSRRMIFRMHPRGLKDEDLFSSPPSK